jgi:hypothetical protein
MKYFFLVSAMKHSSYTGVPVSVLLIPRTASLTASLTVLQAIEEIPELPSHLQKYQAFPEMPRQFTKVQILGPLSQIPRGSSISKKKIKSTDIEA